MADSGSCRRIYAKGLFDGLRKAGIDNPVEFMNERKLSLLTSQQTSAASNVLDAVPKSEQWTISAICQELRRLGKNSDRHLVSGCLNSLRDNGLIREVRKGEFIRVSAKEKMPVAGLKEDEPPIMESSKVTQKAEPMERLAVAAKTTRELADKIRRMADEIEEIALDVDDRIQKIQADTAKLRQLQDLLKSING